jgi:predicted SprT family Zn-dependent metalloprotease
LKKLNDSHRILSTKGRKKKKKIAATFKGGLGEKVAFQRRKKKHKDNLQERISTTGSFFVLKKKELSINT